ncbi:MAP kinase [Aureococcus anophagefferens]|nr:MAP kinase [Aureococcus anophagefferens]
MDALSLNGHKNTDDAMSDAARARLEVLRSLLRTPVRVGDDEYEGLLSRVYENAMALVEADAPAPEVGTPRRDHRCEASRAGWEAIGFQAAAPDREFRGAGMLGLHCLIYALEHRPEACEASLRGPFPFAAASINMTLVAARLAGVVEEGTDDDVAVDPFALGDDGVSESARRAALRHSSLRVSHLLGSSHEGFFELHVAALEALERARRDVDAGPMDFAGCAAARAQPRQAGHGGDAAEPGKPAGVLRLKAGMTVKFRHEARSFSVIGGAGQDALLWLDAKEDREMEQWCIALTEHIALAALDSAALALKARDVAATISSEALDAYFKVADSVGIYVRSAPDVAATRTGRALMPGGRVRRRAARRLPGFRAMGEEDGGDEDIEKHVKRRFEICQRLGKGAYGIVWKAVEKRSHNVIALKKCFDAFRNSTDAQRTFREIIDCHVKLCDFGLCRSVAEVEGPSPVLTDYVATRWYRAPEILLGSPVYTKGVDMWAVGCILGEMLNGKPIFPGTSTVNQLEKVLELTGKPSKEDVDAVGSPYAAQMLDSIGNVTRVPLDLGTTTGDPKGPSVLHSTLKFNPANRVSAVDALNDACSAQDYRNNLYMQISQIKKDARRRDQARGANAENAKPAENANATERRAAARRRGDRAARGGRRQAAAPAAQ